MTWRKSSGSDRAGTEFVPAQSLTPGKVAEYAGLLVIWIGLVLLFGALSDNFLSLRTFATLANRIPALALVATGMTLVLIIGGIDLSVGSVLGLCGAVLGVALVTFHTPLWAAILLSLGVGRKSQDAERDAGGRRPDRSEARGHRSDPHW